MGSYFDPLTVQTIGVYSATFSGVALALAQDCFAIQAPATRLIEIRNTFLNQISDFGAAESEIVGVDIIRGYTAFGSGGSAYVPDPLRKWFPPSEATVRINDTTVAVTGIPKTVLADGWNVAAGWVHSPAREDEQIWLDAGEMAVVRITAPADALNGRGTLTWRECSI